MLTAIATLALIRCRLPLIASHIMNISTSTEARLITVEKNPGFEKNVSRFLGSSLLSFFLSLVYEEDRTER